jgi:hypothetical protein
MSGTGFRYCCGEFPVSSLKAEAGSGIKAELGSGIWYGVTAKPEVGSGVIAEAGSGITGS